jgi:hypothetical protein
MLFFNLSRKSHLSQCFLDISLFPKNKAKLSVNFMNNIFAREGGREGGRNLNGHRSSDCAIATKDMPVLVNQELGKIPLYPISQKSRFTCLEELVYRCSIWSINTNLDAAES